MPNTNASAAEAARSDASGKQAEAYLRKIQRTFDKALDNIEFDIDLALGLKLDEERITEDAYEEGFRDIQDDLNSALTKAEECADLLAMRAPAALESMLRKAAVEKDHLRWLKEQARDLESLCTLELGRLLAAEKAARSRLENASDDPGAQAPTS
jgi:hypothetical protein